MRDPESDKTGREGVFATHARDGMGWPEGGRSHGPGFMIDWDRADMADVLHAVGHRLGWLINPDHSWAVPPAGSVPEFVEAQDRVGDAIALIDSHQKRGVYTPGNPGC
jgi:hypothetical protein